MSKSDNIEEIKKVQLDDARVVSVREKGRIRWCSTNRRWMVYEGGVWHPSEEETIKRFVIEYIDSLLERAIKEEDRHEKENLVKHRSMAGQNQYISGVTRLLPSVDGLMVPIEQFNQHPFLLNVANGVIDLKSGELLEHHPELYLSKKSPISFVPGHRSDLWEGFLQDIFEGDLELIAYVKRAVGYSLTGSCQEQCWFFLYGEGDNGKTTFLEALSYVWGSYVESVQSTAFLQRNNDAIRCDLAKLVGARLIPMAEVSGGKRIDSALLKQFTGGDRISARFLRENETTFTPQGKIWMYGNQKPLIIESDKGAWRRPRLIPFLYQIPEEKKDKDFKNRLIGEAKAILAWAVEGCLEWQDRGKLDEPKKVLDATKEYQTEMDPVLTWIGEWCDTSPIYSDLVGDLYKAFSLFLQQEGYDRHYSQMAFANNLHKKGYVRDHNLKTSRIGIRLKPEIRSKITQINTNIYLD